jgi:hypothetical protein
MTNTSLPRRWDPWPVSIIAFFIIAIIGCVTFVVFCARHSAELVAADYYDQEVRYQGQMDRVQRTGQRGQVASVTYDATRKRIAISLPGAGSREAATGSVQLYRPSAASLDQQFKLEPGPNGVQTLDAAGLEPGLWKVRVSWTIDHLDYFIDEKLVIPAAPHLSQR